MTRYLLQRTPTALFARNICSDVTLRNLRNICVTSARCAALCASSTWDSRWCGSRSRCKGALARWAGSLTSGRRTSGLETRTATTGVTNERGIKCGGCRIGKRTLARVVQRLAFSRWRNADSGWWVERMKQTTGCACLKPLCRSNGSMSTA